MCLHFVDVLAHLPFADEQTLHLAENTGTHFLDCLLPHNLWLLKELLQCLDHLRLVPVLWRCSTTVALARHGLMLRRALGPLRRMATVLPFGPRLTPPQPKPGQALEPKWLRYSYSY